MPTNHDGVATSLPGRVLFRRWLEEQAEMSLVAAGETLGVSHGHLSNILKGRDNPGLALAARIEGLTGGAVPAVSWVGETSAEPAPAPVEVAR